MNYLPAGLCILALSASYWLGHTPLIIPVVYAALSVTAFILYAKDKSAALNGNWRVSEGSLHLLSLLGGWPGAVVAQQRLRHKTRKIGFRIPFWITVIANSAALGWLHTDTAALYMNTYLFKAETILVDQLGSGTARSMLLALLGYHV